MGYQAFVKRGDQTSIFDLREDIEKTIGKKIEIGFQADIPKDEKRYTLKDAKVGLDVRGAYIHFFLDDGNNVTEFILNGIKNYEYDIQDQAIKYWVCISDDELYPLVFQNGSAELQKGNKVYRFILFVPRK